jgi:hypothetical protein
MVLPYLKGFSISCVQYFGDRLVFIIGLLMKYIWILFRYLTIVIIALSLAKEGENFWLFFAIFFKKKKEGGALQVRI